MWSKKVNQQVFVTTLSDIERFSEFLRFHTKMSLSNKFALKQRLKHPTVPNVFRHTTLQNVNIGFFYFTTIHVQ